MWTAKWSEKFSIYSDLIALIVCLSTVFGIWYWGVNDAREVNHQLDVKQEVITEKLDNYFEHLYDYTNGIKGLYEGLQLVEPDELSRFVMAMMGSEDYPPLLGFAVAENVVSDQAFIHTLGVNAKGKILEVIPESASHNYDEREQILWVDSLENELGEKGAGLLLNTAVIKADKVTAIVSEVVSIEKLTHEISTWLEPDMQVNIRLDGKDLGRVGREKLSQPIVREFEIVIEGKIWELRLAMEQKVNPIWNVILAVGVVMSFLVYGIIYAMNLSGKHAKELAMMMTRDLAKYRQALESSDNHIVITDVEGQVVYANPAVTKLTGFSREEVLGKTPRLWGKQMDRQFYEKLWRTIKVDRKVFIGELTNKRKDGTKYEAYATISPIMDTESKELLGFVGIEYDVTERKTRENELKRLNNLMVGRELKMAELKQQLAEKQT